MTFKKELQKKGIDLAILFKHEDNLEKGISKLCNIFTETGSFFGVLYIPVKGNKKPNLVISSLEEVKTNSSFKLSKFKTKKELFKPLEKSKAKIIGLNESALTVSQSKWLKKEIRALFKKRKITFKDISKEVLFARREKNTSELKKLQKAVDITENIFKKTYKIIPKCKTENEIIEYLKIQTLKAGCTLSYEPIVASGKNAAKIHYHSPPKTKLEKGFCVIDFAVCYEGYHADITRTPYLGKPSTEDIINYELVKNALFDTERDMQPEEFYEKYFKKNMKIGPFPLQHALGHGIGLQIHEAPSLGMSKDKICTDDTIAIEPGIYVSGKKPFGIRIEDNYHVTKKGLKRLSKSSRELKIIPIK